MIKSAKNALASHFGWDISEMKDYEYQHGRFTKPVFAVGDEYWCASTDDKKLPKSADGLGVEFKWEEVKDGMVNESGWKIFKSVSVEDVAEKTPKKKYRNFDEWFNDK